MNGSYIMKVPLSIFGRIFWWYFKRTFNYSLYRIRRRGRHPNRQRVFKWLKFLVGYTPNNNEDVPIKFAKEFAVYLDKKGPYQAPTYYESYHETVDTNRKLREKLDTMNSVLTNVLDACYENGQSREEMVGDIRRIISEEVKV